MNSNNLANSLIEFERKVMHLGKKFNKMEEYLEFDYDEDSEISLILEGSFGPVLKIPNEMRNYYGKEFTQILLLWVKYNKVAENFKKSKSDKTLKMDKTLFSKFLDQYVGTCSYLMQKQGVET